MATSKDDLIKLLNKDLEKEYAAAVQYINHAAVMTGAKYGDIIKELNIHANEEIAHAIILAGQISYLGGDPAVDVAKVNIDKDNDKMLEQDLAGEEDAIRRYKERVKQAEELEEYALSQQLRTILAQEQEHAMDLEQALGK